MKKLFKKSKTLKSIVFVLPAVALVATVFGLQFSNNASYDSESNSFNVTNDSTNASQMQLGNLFSESAAQPQVVHHAHQSNDFINNLSEADSQTETNQQQSSSYAVVNDGHVHLTILADEHGSADYSPKQEALEGKTVTLIPSPSEGYELLYWEIIEDKGDVTIDYETNTFVMPYHDVAIQPHFIEESWVEIKTAEDLLSITQPGNYYLSSTIGEEGLVLNKTWAIPHTWELFSSKSDTTSLDLNGKKLSLSDSASSTSPVINLTHNIFYSSSTVFNLLDSSSACTGEISNGHAGGVKVDGGVFNMGGGNIRNNTNSSSGGGVVVVNGGTFNFEFGTIEDNCSKLGGGVSVTSGSVMQVGIGASAYVEPDDYPSISFNRATADDGTGCFGAVYVNEASASFYCSRIEGNYAELRGGALGCAYPASSLLPSPSVIDVYEDTLIVDNSSSYGGAIYNKAILNVNGAKIQNNSAVFGGAVCNEIIGVETMATFTGNAEITDNIADYGGGIYNVETLKIPLLKAGIEFDNVLLKNNCAEHFGGAVLNMSTVMFTGYDVEITENIAGEFGAGLVSGQFGVEGSILKFLDDNASCYISNLPHLYNNTTENGTLSDLVVSPGFPLILDIGLQDSNHNDKIHFNIYDKQGVERCGKLTYGYSSMYGTELDKYFVYQEIEGHEGFQSWGDQDCAYRTENPELMKEIWVDHEHQWEYTHNKDELEVQEVLATCNVQTEPICSHPDTDHALVTTIAKTYGLDSQFDNTPQKGVSIIADEITKGTDGDAYIDYDKVIYKGIGTTVYPESVNAPKLLGSYEVTYPLVTKVKSGSTETIPLVLQFSIIPQTVLVNFLCADKEYDSTDVLLDKSYTYQLVYTDDEVADCELAIEGAKPDCYVFTDAIAANCVRVDTTKAKASVVSVPADWTGSAEEFLACFNFEFNPYSVKGTVKPRDIQTCTLNLIQDKFEYDGNWHSPKYEIKFTSPTGEEITVIKGIGYTDSGNIPLISKGDYTWNVIGLGNFNGSFDFDWSIV